MQFFKTIVSCTINWKKQGSVHLINNVIDIGKLTMENKSQKKVLRTRLDLKALFSFLGTSGLLL